MTTLNDNDKTLQDITRIIEIFKNSAAEIRPHFILTGPSGSGKSHTINALAEQAKLPMLEINAAQLTKEGTSGNSLSKALAPLLNLGGRPAVCFVDEFDKLFISGNTNSSLAHETTNGVQNEFLKVLEGKTTAVYGDYGKYVDAPVDNVLFVFAGAFNGEEDIDIDRLREFGIKTEFLGRVGLTYALAKLTVADLERILRKSSLLREYLLLFPKVEKNAVLGAIMAAVRENYEHNTLGARVLSTLIHQYFINGGALNQKQVQRTTFQRTMDLERDEREALSGMDDDGDEASPDDDLLD
jgi:ATP-dependent protease Clp ATPase subunit